MEMTKDILEMQHILNNLARIDLLLHREILRWRAAGQDPKDAFRGLYVTDEEVTALLERPMGSNWGELAELQTDLNQDFDASYDRIQQRIESVADKIRAGGSPPRLTHLQDSFHLLDIELDTVLLCLSAALDLRYERIFGFLQDDVTKKKPTVNLILNLLSNAQTPRHEELMIFFDQATLFRNRILHKGEEGNSGQQPLLNRPLSLNATIVRWLIGDYQVPELLGIHAQFDPPSTNKSLSLLAHPNESALKITNGTPPLIIFTGQDWTSQRSTALHLASRAQKPLLTINLQPLVEAGNPPMDLVEIGLRDARLNSAIPLFSGWDVVLKNDRAPGPLLERLYQFEDLIILCSLNPWLPGGPERLRELRTLNFSFPKYQKRLAIWDHFTDQMFSNQPDLLTLAGQFVLTVGQIRDAAATARDFAQQRGEALTIKDLFAAARAHSNPRLSSLARKIEPRFGWEDIVLPQDQITLLHEIVATVQERPRVLDDWGVGSKLASSRGVTMLFAGPPGTGKTMAAEIIAAELGLDLFKIDLSTVVSKYIGETEKNLERIFAEATSSNAILFFDEADALFGKRSEVRDSHDRYANIEISYLLQRMEAYDGVTILATNLRANLDEAFTRRLQFAVEFPFPEEVDRLRIWNALFPEGLPCDPDLDFDLLAGRFKLAGGNIRNIIVNAAFLASDDGGIVTMAHLLHGTRRELQKMGRLINEEELAHG